MSFSDLRDMWGNRIGHLEPVLSLKSPKYAKEYLISLHKVAFPTGDKIKQSKWMNYPLPKNLAQLQPIYDHDLKNPKFTSETAEKLSFDISRFTEFLSAYNKVDSDIKPIMLHYSLIYLSDFFSRSWLKYGENPAHGLKLLPQKILLETEIKFTHKGIFPRVADAFYLLDESSLFSLDDKKGISQIFNQTEEYIKQTKKSKYSEEPKVRLCDLLKKYAIIKSLPERIASKSNPILIGYAILFSLSSISRYRAKDWYKINTDRDLKSKFELLQHDILYNGMPELLIQTIFRDGIRSFLTNL